MTSKVCYVQKFMHRAVIIKWSQFRDVKKNGSENQGRIFYNGMACKYLNDVLEDFKDMWKCFG